MSEAETLKMVMVNDTEPLCPRGTEEVFQALEDNQVALSTMKASRFVKAFEKDVDHWERCLSLTEAGSASSVGKGPCGWTSPLSTENMNPGGLKTP